MDVHNISLEFPKIAPLTISDCEYIHSQNIRLTCVFCRLYGTVVAFYLHANVCMNGKFFDVVKIVAGSVILLGHFSFLVRFLLR